jgi:uncharacterized protein (DUF2384 family)
MTVQQKILERAALGDQRPADLLETPDGRDAVEDLLSRLIVGTYG